ncbi:hypothetical protein [Ralstonia insidiosa]|nr:hypothetical protein [Ralstonia insidiosa]MBA9939327.1 hypothetical protein [Ralstonia insidiosa]MBC9968098.1 hypothetical protein [Ralstonia insidiosa]MBX3904339.1 hypothetical protein [Ralstonia insidiosa]
MSDFSTIKIAKDCGLFPVAARTGWSFQSKDMPDDGEYSCCVDGEIDATGRFVRVDDRGRFWNPELNGWIHLRIEFERSDLELVCRFADGRVVEVRDGHGVRIEDGSVLPGAYWSPSVWVRL